MPPRNASRSSSTAQYLNQIDPLDLPLPGTGPSSSSSVSQAPPIQQAPHIHHHHSMNGHAHSFSPRGNGTHSALASREGSASGPASRKPSENNLNHLLNFRMPPRHVPGAAGAAGSGAARGEMPRRSRGVRNSAFNKEKYVNSQFRFVMKPTGNYTAHFADPDLFFPWPQILQVIVPTISPLALAQGDDAPCASASASAANIQSNGVLGAGGGRRERESYSCPICLGRPVAGRMTKCGHIFCFPCILHYFQLSDVPKSAKCPICGDTIQEFLLKGIRWWDGVDFDRAEEGGGGVGLKDAGHGHGHGHRHVHSGEEDLVAGELEFDSASLTRPHRINMRLMQRPQITTLGLPRSSTWPSDAIPINQAPWHFLPNVMVYSKFMLATSTYMLSELDRELRELEEELRVQEGDELGKSFVEAAMRKVMEQMEKARGEMDTPVLRRMEREAREAVGEVDERFGREMRVLEERERRRVERELSGVGGEGQEEEERIPREMLEVTAQGAFALANRPPGELRSSQSTSATETISTGAGHSATPAIPASASSGGIPGSGKPKAKRPGGMAIQHPSYFTPDAPSYIYYQAASGANIYLSPLDIKILLAHYKSYTNFPENISIRPEGADEGTMNEDLRRRCKYLGHLQVGTDVVFIEADLEDTLGSEALLAFEAPLKRRRDRRKDRIKKEDKAKSKWEAQEREKLPFGMRQPGSGGIGGGEVDEEFLMALERSNLETSGVSPTTSSLIASMTAVHHGNNGLSPNALSSDGSAIGRPSSSPVAERTGTWGSPPSASTRSWASALHAPPGSRPPVKKRDPAVDDEVSRAWMAFEESAAASKAVAEVNEQEASGAKAGGKKGRKKVVLSMGGGGRRG